MRLFLTTLFLTFLSSIILGQRILIEESIDFEYNKKDEHLAIPIYDSINKTYSIFFQTNNCIKGYLYQNFQVSDSISIKFEDKFNNELAGQIKIDDDHHIFFINKKTSQLYNLSVNFVNSSWIIDTIDFKTKDECVLNYINCNDSFYILSILKTDSKLLLYKFTKEKGFIKNYLDLSKIYSSENNIKTLFEKLKKNVKQPGHQNMIDVIDQNIPTPFNYVINKNKLYCFKDNLYLTVDDFQTTKIIKIDLENFTCSLISNIGNCNTLPLAKKAQTNTFMIHNLLFNLCVSKEYLSLNIVDIEKDSVMIRFHTKNWEDIKYKNTPITQIGGQTWEEQNRITYLKSTKALLRYMVSSNIGISVFELDNAFEIMIGEYIEYPPDAGLVGRNMRATGLRHGSTFRHPVFYHDMKYYSQNWDAYSRITYFGFYLDKKNFIPQKDSTYTCSYYFLLEYMNLIANDIIFESILSNDSCYLFGFYHLVEKKYYLVSTD